MMTPSRRAVLATAGTALLRSHAVSAQSQDGPTASGY
jgi:hypothetical protein